MPRKFKKGYFVSGQFVEAGSALDEEFQRELKGSDGPSRTSLKRESTELQQLGTDLLTVRSELLLPLQLPEKLLEALQEARSITNFEGKRRQMQFIGKLMRQLEPAQLDGIRAALVAQHSGSAEETAALHQAEAWREQLIAEDDAFERWLTAHPGTDGQQLRALIRQARKDAKPARPGEAPRHGKAYRELFQIVRAGLTTPAEHP